MNIYATIILAAILSEHLLRLVADYLNLKTLAEPLPEEFEGMYDRDAYRKSQQYTRTRTIFGAISSTAGLIVMLVFWFLGGFQWLDVLVRGWGLGEIRGGLAYIGILLAGRSLLSLPFTIYSTFVIEEHYGFNRTTPKTFAADMAKGIALAVALGGPFLAGILALFSRAGTLAWLYCWMAGALFTLIVQFIAPAWIMPLFNKFTPLEDGELRRSILAYAESVKFSLQNVFVMDGSKRSSKSNAFFTGFGRNKRIALFDTLIQKHTVAELVAVLAHEIGHYKRKHILQGLVTSILHMGILFFLLSIFLNQRGLFDAFQVREMSVYAGLIFFGMLYTPIEFILSFLLHMISRKHEYEADRWAAETTGQPQSMIDALKKLSVDNLSHLTPHWLTVSLYYSHPPVLQRIQALRAPHRSRTPLPG